MRLSPVARLDLEDEVISLAGRAAVLGYPKGRLPMSIRELAAYDHATLADKFLRLKAWVAEREEQRERQR